MTEKTVVVHSAGQHAVAEHALLVEDALGIDGAERDATAFGAAVAVLADRLANSTVAERVGRTIGLGFTADRFADAADRLFGGVAFITRLCPSLTILIKAIGPYLSRHNLRRVTAVTIVIVRSWKKNNFYRQDSNTC